MAHPEQANYFKSVRNRFPDRFLNCSVLDIGSLDINGNNRHLFSNYKYVGVDIGKGRNVDVVSRGHEFKSEEKFDVVISAECFEHDEFWPLTIQNGIDLLKLGGLFLFSCATDNRPEHGTKRTTPQDSPFTSELENDYYQNLSPIDILTKVEIDKQFVQYEFFVRRSWPQDMYFYGIKNGQ